MNNKRDISIDALRGLAILGMVLSGTIAQMTDIPGWMYHAQVGPPDFKFHPEIPGITWVDLVFPFFLFTMGLSFPFAMNRYIEQNGTRKLMVKVLFRSFNLFVFAVALAHLSPYGLPESFGAGRYVFTLLGFISMFATFSKFPKFSKYEQQINIGGYISLLLLMIVRHYLLDVPFSIHRHDIIILLLSNMALIAAAVWVLTRNNWWPRMAILVVYFAIRLTAGIDGSINQQLYQFNLLVYICELWPSFKEVLQGIGIELGNTIFTNMYYLKYLLIVLPGSVIGDIAYRNLKRSDYEMTEEEKSSRDRTMLLAIGLVLFIPINLLSLYSRLTWLLYAGNICLLVSVLALFTRMNSVFKGAYKSWLSWSFFWLFLGILFEPYEGGIKKDISTLSYFFVTSGLAGLSLLSLKLFYQHSLVAGYLRFLPQIGKNPMVGYVVVTYLLIPIMGITGVLGRFNDWTQSNIYAGIFRGILLTGTMVLVTIFTVKRKYLWKT
ncbi:MAG: DUF5009 domain-containing protein [Bacteroidales bacterium]|nr:DUF5009 domain-containing protein [Bacteroidales bacterium]